MMAHRRRLLLSLAVVVTATACRADDDGGNDTLPAATGDVSLVDPPGTAGVGSGSGGDGTERPTTGPSSAPPSTRPDPPTTAPDTVTTTSAPTTTTTTAPATTTTALATTTTLPATTTTLVPQVDAAAYVVFDMRSGEQLAAQEADTRLAVGSLMKLLAAQVAYDAGDPTKILTAPEGLVISPEESVIGIFTGQELARDLLIRAMLKVSANDAARMLAIDIAGSEAAYAEVMNATAANLGLANTRAVNVTGLDAEGQYSSANDLMSLGVRLMGNITFQQTVKEPNASLNGVGFENTNDLLGVYPGADGIKTGRTTQAGWCILASANRDNRRIVVAVLGAPTEEARDQAATALSTGASRSRSVRR